MVERVAQGCENMGWETRGNGRYYYRKVRDGGRVISEYIGGGVLAEAYAELDADARGDSAAARAAWSETVQAERQHDAALAEVDELVQGMTAAVLIAAGYHTHGRQWRRQR